MSPTQTQDTTLLEALTERLRECTSTSDGIARPAAILWTDPKRQWQSLMPTLLSSIPELLIYGEYDPESRTGPAIWLRCMVDRALDTPALPDDVVPILYLPGVARQMLRAGEDCQDALTPLVELMFRGSLWLQRGGHDWTVTAFMTAPNELKLELRGDKLTSEALLRALPEFASEPLNQFRGQRLQANDFDQMLASDVVRDLLLWMNDPASTRERKEDDSWKAFCSQCRAKFGFDPDSGDVTTAGEHLGGGQEAWGTLWDRFQEAPKRYPGIPDLLRRSKPGGLVFDKARWPDENEQMEEEVHRAFAGIKDLSHTDACAKVLELEIQHAMRRSWVWNQLERAPLAQVLAPLSELAKHAKTTIGGSSPDDFARTYIESGWRADRASWQAVAMAKGANETLVHGVVGHLLGPWLDGSARAFQKSMDSCPLPDHGNSELVTVPEKGCLLFADGLRYDVGEELRDRLESMGCRVRMEYRWAAIPTVTATAKPAITPVASAITGSELPEDFAPLMVSSQKPANASALRAELEKEGYQVLRSETADWPDSDEARGWTEDGKIDTRGHDLQVDLAGILDEEVARLAHRITSLFDSGWTSVRVVTDHGWLYLPQGLPRVALPKHLTESRWARCAVIAGQSQVDVPTAPWHWNTTERFATGPGITCFTASNCYAHGGLSLQECLTPDLHIERSTDARERASIESVAWKGMRCFVVARDCSAEIRADLRLETTGGASVAASIKPLDEEGTTSLLLQDDEHESTYLVVVLIGTDDQVVAQHKTKVGIDS